MQMIYRLLLVTILVMIGIIIVMDYVGFHGSIIMERIGGVSVVAAVDSFFMLFQGKEGNTNILYMTIFGACAGVGLIAIFYKFIKG